MAAFWIDGSRMSLNRNGATRKAFAEFVSQAQPPSGRELRERLPRGAVPVQGHRSEEHTSELQSLAYLVCRLLLEKKKKTAITLRPPASREVPRTARRPGTEARIPYRPGGNLTVLSPPSSQPTPPRCR